MPLIKRKSIPVILVTSLIISLVFLLTLVACYVYIEMKERKAERGYSEIMRKLEDRL